MVERTKLTKKILMALVVFTLTITSIVACTNSTSEPDSKETEKKVTTVEEETTTEEVTTEEETTFVPEETIMPYEDAVKYYDKYKFKGTEFNIIDESIYQKLLDFEIFPGDTISLNYICDETVPDLNRGDFLYALYYSLGMDTTEICNKYGNGIEILAVPYEDDYTFVYTGDKHYKFDLVVKYYNFKKTKKYCFDFYSVE